MTQAWSVVWFAASTAAVTMIGGWWLIPVLAALWVRVVPRTSLSARKCAMGAALGWAGILPWGAMHDPFGNAARRVGGVFHLPGWALIVITLAFAAALAGSGAAAARRPPMG